MTEKLDYRVIEAQTILECDYMENEVFENFYMELKKVCDKHNVHISSFIRREDVLCCEEKE